MATEDRPFTLNVKGEETGTQWFGEFRAKIRLSRRDIITKDRLRREMLGSAGGAPDEHASLLARAWAEVKVRVTLAPPWFLESDFGMDLEDESPLANVYQKAMKIEAEESERKAKEATDKAAEMKAEQAAQK